MSAFITGTKRFIKHILSFWRVSHYPHVDKTAIICENVRVFNPNNLYMAEMTNINENSTIMNTRANVIFMKNSGAAFGFTAVTGNHMSVVGMHLKQVTDKVKNERDVDHEMDKDIVVEEDVWIGNHVTLLSGVRIGRGGEVGGGSVVRKSTPPYSVVAGNPAKVVGFRFTPEEIIEHEKNLYPEEERIPLEMLEKNYKKYFLDRIIEIKSYIKL